MNIKKYFIFIVIIIGIIGVYLFLNWRPLFNDKWNLIKNEQKIPVTLDGNFYTLKISSAYNSTCIWNYAEGNGAVPYAEISTSQSPSGIHTVQNKTLTENAFNYSVKCTDIKGNTFLGEFPGDMEEKYYQDKQIEIENNNFNDLNKYISNNDLSYLRTLDGKYTFEVKLLDNEIIKNRLKNLMNIDIYNKLTNEWDVTSPIKVENNIFTASACQAHNCSEDAFLLVINTESNKFYVIAKIGGKKTYYFENNANIPQQVQDWDLQN